MYQLSYLIAVVNDGTPRMMGTPYFELKALHSIVIHFLDVFEINAHLWM